ncbi:ER protein Pkr1-domain-containing protein [Aspergillus pseudotamarii]|uniref:ER protein Pkr1-domain-containing protein n=1 Tax=Aspergillus pseudotamarii TaxID=132259 RepID=A0A5N6SSC0_ASPPS|nr:ER protein Pkr1-domain-containing protein [Aspergillus pseudotamarii]KAE8137568.1 ER protein Pkr1-domain-containing protein [Aspergillus pseudotamarii]
MVSFVEDLWASIFTPGPTPTLLVAANATFAALQLVLFLLLLATYSIHFVVLSVLSASLWWSINWFAQELAAVQKQEAEKEKTQSKELLTEEDNDDKRKSEVSRRTPGALDSTDSDTETESLMERKISAVSAAAPPSTTTTATTAATLQPPEQQGGIRKRPSMSGESSGYVSTDSEWEKVDDKATA